MTPEEKAKELVDACFRYAKGQTTEARLVNAKCMALIAVDEILKVASFYNDSQAEVIYWQEVKQEIHNL